MSTPFYPLLFTPVYKDYLWGGDRIPAVFHRPRPAGSIFAESWEISDRPEGMSVVSNGPLAGTSLRQLMAERAADILGADEPRSTFPLLVKLIDARERLSVQVHPNDERAARCGGEAKTEAWIPLAGTEPDATVYAGLQPGVDQAAFLRAMKNKTLASVLAEHPARPGEAIFIPGGRVHAICAGCLLLEIQQNSNTTYRVYDWDRTDKDGRPRDLHLDQALAVIDWQDQAPCRIQPVVVAEHAAGKQEQLLACDYFRLTRFTLQQASALPRTRATAAIVFVESGALDLSGGHFRERLPAGTSCLLPAVLPDILATPAGDNCRFLFCER